MTYYKFTKLLIIFCNPMVVSSDDLDGHLNAYNVNIVKVMNEKINNATANLAQF